MGLNLFESCGGPDLGSASTDTEIGMAHCYLDVQPVSEYLIQIGQDADSTAPFMFENRIVPTVPVFGRIVDKISGEGMSSVSLEFHGNQYNRQSTWTTTTDSEGLFALAQNLPEDTYSVSAEYRVEGYKFWVPIGKAALVEGMGPLVFEMERLASMNLIYIDSETGAPITDPLQGFRCPEIAYRDGEYSCDDISRKYLPGLSRIIVSSIDPQAPFPNRVGDTWVNLKGGENRTCLMPMKKTVPIRGNVHDTNGNLWWNYLVNMIGENGWFRTSSSKGSFEIHIPPGVYGCWVEEPDWNFHSYSSWQQITVSDDAELNPDLELVMYYYGYELKTIRGTIRNNDSLPHAGPYDVLALPQGVVPTPDNISTLQERWRALWYGSPDLVYMYELLPGNYDLYSGILSHAKPNFSFTVQEAKLDIPAGTEGLEFVYASEGDTVMGKVLDQDRVAVLVSEIVLNKLPGGEFAGWAKTNPRGQFVFYNVPVGTYTLSAVHRNYTMEQTTVTVPAERAIVTAETLTMNPKGRREGADFNGDGIVDLDDLSNLTADWMQAGTSPADLDGSGVVDLSDLARMSQTWLGQAVWLNRPAQFPEYPAGLIGQWTLDEQVDLKTVLDWSGSGHHGRAQQNLSARVQEGMVNLALRFDGTGDYIDCGTAETLQPVAWTVCAWVKCVDTPSPTLISFGGNYPAVKLQQNDKGRPIVYLGNTNYRYFTASAWTTLKDGLWHHVAFSVPGNDQAAVEQAAMYLDGAAVAESTTMTTGPQADKSRLYLGITSKGGQQRFKGAMDEVLLFDRVLAAEEIESIYRSSR